MAVTASLLETYENYSSGNGFRILGYLDQKRQGSVQLCILGQDVIASIHITGSHYRLDESAAVRIILPV